MSFQHVDVPVSPVSLILDRTPIKTAHLCSTSLFTSAERIACACLKNCLTFFVRLKRICHLVSHMSHPLLPTHLTPAATFDDPAPVIEYMEPAPAATDSAPAPAITDMAPSGLMSLRLATTREALSTSARALSLVVSSGWLNRKAKPDVRKENNTC